MNYTFVVGFERCGTHSVVDILRSSCKAPAFIKHEDLPHLCYEAYQVMKGGEWETPDLLERIERYKALNRSVRLVCEGNHRLGFFAKYFNDKLPGSRFVLLVRDPVKTLVSRIATLAHWPEIIHRYPETFQAKASNLIPPGKMVFNQFRPKPPNMNAPFYELYLWEWIETYRETISQIANVDQVMLIETESLTKSVGKLLSFVGKEFFDPIIAAKTADIKADSVYDHTDKFDLIAFAKDIIEPHADYIKKVIRQEFSGDGIIARITA